MPAKFLLDRDWSARCAIPIRRWRSWTPRFARYRLGSAAIERLWTGARWAEGPVWFGDQRCLVFSDIPNDRMLRWSEETGQVSVFRQPSFNANGNTRDRQGRLLTCEHRARRVTRTEIDGTRHRAHGPLRGPAPECAERRRRPSGRRDLVHRSRLRPALALRGRQGRVRTADPHLPPRPGHRRGRASSTTSLAKAQRAGLLARLSAGSTSPTPAPRTSPATRGGSTCSTLADGGRLSPPRVFHDFGPAGSPDGFRVDTDGNVWAAVGWGGPDVDGVRVLARDGEPIGAIHLPEGAANLCFGGVKRNRLFITASQSLYALYVDAQGVPYA